LYPDFFPASRLRLEFLGTENPLLVSAGLAFQEKACQDNLEIPLTETRDGILLEHTFLLDQSNECGRLKKTQTFFDGTFPSTDRFGFGFGFGL